MAEEAKRRTLAGIGVARGIAFGHAHLLAPSELEVRLSPEALAEALRLAEANPQYQGRALRVYIEGKGCDGFYYGVSFDAGAGDDVRFPHAGIDVVVDHQSLRFLFGATVAWVDDERGRGFLVENPNHRRYRGKFFKRQAWQTALARRPSP